MEDLSNHQRAVELLQQLGLKEYEAKSFVALSRLPKGTAKEISETSDVPRTRVYDAIRVLESEGLVEIQHSSPQQFRAVPTEEAAETLRQKYESRTNTLVKAIGDIEPVLSDNDQEITHDVWALTGFGPIENRTNQLIDSAGREIVLVVGNEAVLTDELINHLQVAQGTGITLIIGTQTDQLRETVQDMLPDAEVFVTGLDWLTGSATDPRDGTTISRLLLIDRSSILVSTSQEGAGEPGTEKAVFGRGFDNGIVVIARRLMATGLPATVDPEHSEG